jgi:hypothetical protein
MKLATSASVPTPTPTATRTSVMMPVALIDRYGVRKRSWTSLSQLTRMRSRPIAKLTRAAERMEAFALETVASTAPTIISTDPNAPRAAGPTSTKGMAPAMGRNVLVATSATGISDPESTSSGSVPVETYITPTYSSVGVTTDAIIASGRFRLGFLISSALVAMTSNPMNVTYTVPTVAATAGQP